ncbi:MAG: PKD domain-containing protein, partial [Psychrosphaera sp.]|nr:PKD domain-containing protein [Psychrosphaera sp.]
LAAAYANDVVDYAVLLGGFAERGLGLGAISPPRRSEDLRGVVESFKTHWIQVGVQQHTIEVNYQGLMGGYCSNDNILDKGETGSIEFTASNLGNQVFEGLSARVEVDSPHNVTFTNGGIIDFGDLTVLGSKVSSAIEFTLNESQTNDILRFKVTFVDLPQDQYQPYIASIRVNYDFSPLAPADGIAHHNAEDPTIEHDFKEHVLSGGEAAKGTGRLSNDYVEVWQSFGLDMGLGSLLIKNNDFESDIAYQTRLFEVGQTGALRFEWAHLWDFEASHDGGVIEISIDDADWVDVLDAGGSFVSDGYNANLASVLSGRSAFTGFGVAFEVVTFDSSLNGHWVRLRFRAATDNNTAAAGWLIDDIKISNVQTPVFSQLVAGDTHACDNRVPLVSIEDDKTVNAGDTVTLSVTASDLNGDPLSYAWTQLSGSQVTLTNADSTTATFIAPLSSVTPATLEFEVLVSDGTDSVSQNILITVTSPVVAPPPITSGTGSSGGVLDLMLLLLLIPIMIRKNQ